MNFKNYVYGIYHIWGSHVSDVLDLSPLGCYFMLFGKELPTFQGIILPSPSASCNQCNAIDLNIYTCVSIHLIFLRV